MSAAAQQASAALEIGITFFSNQFAKKKREERLSPIQLAERISKVSQPTKDRLPWLKLARFGDLRSDEACLRHDDNILGITGIEGDYDAKPTHAGRLISYQEAVARVRNAGISAIVYTSPSYTEDLQKYRVLAPLSAEYPPQERDRFMARLNGLFEGGFAPESFTLSQSYYFGAVNHNPSHRVEVLDGVCIDMADYLDAAAIGRPEKPTKSAGNGQHRAARPDEITDKRIRGLVASLLNHVRNAKEGEKYFTLRDISYTVGGYLHIIGWRVEQAVETLIGELPSTVKDWSAARDTAEKAIRAGMERPLDLEERPNSNTKQMKPKPEPETKPEAPQHLFDPWGDFPPPAWPGNILKQEYEATIAQLAERDGCDFGVLAMAFIGAVSGAADKSMRFEPYQHAGFKVPPIVYLMPIADSGFRKSAITSTAFRAIERRDQEEWRDHQARVRDWKDRGADEKEKPQPPTPRIFENATIEALQALVSRDERGSLLLRDELAPLFDFQNIAEARARRNERCC